MNYSKSRVTFAAYAGVAFFGITMLSLGTLLPGIIDTVDGAMSFPAILSAGILTGTVLFGPVMDRYGYKWLLVFSSAILLAGLAGIAHSRSSAILGAAFFLTGAGGGILNGETIAFISDIYDDAHRAVKLAVLGASYCIGCILWTLACTIFKDIRIPLYGGISVIALYIIFLLFTRFPEKERDANRKGDGPFMLFIKSFRLVKHPVFVIVAVLLFFQTALEAASAIFPTTYLSRVPSALPAKQIILSLTMLTLGMTAGRFLLKPAMKKMRDIPALELYLSFAIISSILIFFLPTVSFAVCAAMFLMGFGTGATSPVILNYLGVHFKSNSGSAVSLAIFIALCGQLVVNLILGRLFAGTGSGLSYMRYLYPALMILLAITIMVMAPVVAKKSVEKGDE